jgi:chromosome partitioning protein
VNKLISKISDFVLIPLIPTVLSMRSLNMVYDFFESENINKGKIHPFFSMADMRKGIHKNIIDENIKRFNIKTVIPYSSEIEKMGIHLKAVNDFSNSKNIKEIYERFKDEILLLCKKINE